MAAPAFAAAASLRVGHSVAQAQAPRCARRAQRARKATYRACASADNSRRALIWDCDGVIVESEELHRLSYNQCWASEGLGFEWDVPFYEMLQNSIGGGKEKMRWYFDKYGWPERAETDREAFIRMLHEAKTQMYKDLITGGDVCAREGVLRVMDEAHAQGFKTAICSAANASAVGLVLDTLLGAERLGKFDVVLAGDFAGDATRKKPDPMIYNVARERLGVDAEDCVVVEDSQIGLQAAVAAGMRVLITHTPYTASQVFDGAEVVVPTLGAAGDGVSMGTLFPGVGA